MIFAAVLWLTSASLSQTDSPDAPPPKTQSPPTTTRPSAPTNDRIAAPPDSNASIANWLVHLAQHQGHLVGRSDPRSASLHVLSLLEAAIEVDPQCAEAYYWLFDLQHRMNQSKQAAQSLAQYCRLAPNDDAARVRLLELGLDEQQTAENRLKFVQSCLGQTPLSPAYESELRYWLARHHYERNDTQQAGKELEDALRLNPFNIEARELAYEMYGETEAELQRVEMMLQLVSINPSQANIVWELGEFLDRLSLHKQAQEWFNRAITIHKSADNAKISAEYWHTLALSYLSSRDYAKAKETAEAALDAAPDFHAARLIRSTALSKLGKADDAAADLAAVRKAYESRIDEVVSMKLTGEAAEIAWFFSYHAPDKDKALRLSEIADSGPNPSHQARLAHGYALRAAGKTDDALKILEPLAPADQLAALELARIYVERSQKADAVKTLIKAASLQYSGIAFDLTCDALTKLGEKPPEAPSQPRILAALERFHRDVFDFANRPGDFVKFSIRMASSTTDPIAPILLTCRIENAGPFPISFGEGFMIRPLVAISASVKGAEASVFKDYLQVLMNSRTMLLPGDAVEKTVAADIGPFREYLVQHSADSLKIEFNALLDPVIKNGELAKAAGTITAKPLTVTRPALENSAATIETLVKQAAATSIASRINAADALGAFLAARSADASRTAQPPDKAPRDSLARLLIDPDWRVRAHALVAAGQSAMDPATTTAASRSVQDANSVVKLLALRLFAEQHGEKFKPVLDKLSKSDASHPVRMMCLSYLPESPRTQAARTDPGEPGTAPDTLHNRN